jgi:hypothetical protein
MTIAPGPSPRLRGEGWPKAGVGAVFLLLLLFLAFPAFARPQVLVVIADHLTLTDVMQPGLPNLTRLRTDGQTALMSPGLAQGKDPIDNVYAALGAGDSIQAGNVSQGRMAAVLRQTGIRTALIGDADGDDTGAYRPATLLLPFADEIDSGSRDGTAADQISCGGRRVDPAKLWAQTQRAFGHSDLVVVHDGDFARVERENQRGWLLPSAYRQHRQQALTDLDEYLGFVLKQAPSVADAEWQLFLVVPTAPSVGDRWDQLTPFFRFSGARRKTSGELWSETTQTPGLISTRDLAPTLLAVFGLPLPIQMTGAVLRSQKVASAPEWTTLRRLDRLTQLNQDAQDPLFWSLGFAAAAVIFAGLDLFLSGRMAAWVVAGRGARYGLRLLSAWPLALLLAPLADPATLGVYFTWICCLTALLALLPTPSAIYALTATVLLIDGFTGTRLVSQSVLSAYALSGIRFYGIGNEYMGLLIGGTLLMAGGKVPEGRIGGILLFFLFALVIFVLSFPDFGAKAGGAVTATATFVVAWRGLRGLSVHWKHGVGGILGGFGLVFLWALMGHWLPMRHTHIESAVGAVGQGRLGYIAGVALRKIGLAAHVFLHPGTLLGLLGIGLIVGFARLFLRKQVEDYLRRHARFAAVWRAGLWGCLVAVLFNDSGVVAAILLLTCLIVTLLHGLYTECALLPLMSGKSESVSPSATS